jgi:hypothetical protein
VSNGGFLDLRLTDQGWNGGNWDGLVMPGGLSKTSVYLQNVSINLPLHPILNNPFLVEDVELDGWLYSAHGYFHEYPTGAKKILLYPVANEPVMLEFMYGSGFIVATMQTIEWNENKNLTRILENMILYNPGAGFTSINITSPISNDSWEVGSTQTITWDATGTINIVKIDLYMNGAFVTEITASTPNDGSFTWLVTPGLTDSTLYQVRVSDADYPLTYDNSDNFEIEDLRSITVTSPISGDHWIMENDYYINWTSTGTIPNVKIELYASSILILEVAASTPNDGSFLWSIPNTLVNFTDYVIRVSDLIDPTLFDDSDLFTITGVTGGGIPGYDVLILGGLLGVVSLTIIMRKRKKILVHEH